MPNPVVLRRAKGRDLAGYLKRRMPKTQLLLSSEREILLSACRKTGSPYAVVDLLASAYHFYLFSLGVCYTDSSSSALSSLSDPIGLVVPVVGTINAVQATSGRRPSLTSLGATFSSHDLTLPGFNAGTPLTHLISFNPTTTTPVALFDSAPNVQNTWRNFDVGRWEWQNESPAFNFFAISGSSNVISVRGAASPNREITSRINTSSYTRSFSGVTLPIAYTTPAIGSINGTLRYYSGSIKCQLFFSRYLEDQHVSLLHLFLANFN